MPGNSVSSEKYNDSRVRNVVSAAFEDWVKAVFDHPPRERKWYWDDQFEAFWDSFGVADALAVEYMTRLFSEPHHLQRYSLAQVAQGIWFLIGEASPGKTAYTLINRDVALKERIVCIQSMINFFRLFVDPATKGVADTKYDPFHIACFMWWDIFPTYGGGQSAEEEIHAACLNAMAEILTLPSEVCRLNALHGLNHWHASHAEQVEQIVDAFLRDATALTPRVLDYARTARAGEAL
jgi:hypothetical protein